MKITIEPVPPGGEEEIIIRADDLDPRLLRLIGELKTDRPRLTGTLPDGSIKITEYKSVYYFESVDNKVFAYSENDVLEVKYKLYELEELLSGTDFLRISKAVIVNLSKVRRLNPSLNGRFEADLKNGEKVIISRQYVPHLKQYFGL